MKKLIIPALILGTFSSNAAVLPTNNNGQSNSDKSATTTVTNIAKKPIKTSTPTRFYISAKGGYNMMLGSIYTDEKNNTALSISNSAPIFSGAIGVDFNRDPSIRLELEVTNAAASEVKFDDGWDSLLHADVGYTSLIFNFIPYFKINDYLNFDLIIGLGAANIDFKDTDDHDYLHMESAKIAFAANFGLGLDIKLSDSFSILPEVKYTLLATTIDYGTFIPYYGYVGSEGNTFLMHNFQFMAGVKYTF